MSLHFVSGDMWKREADVRVNTVNCVGTWGKGVALQFKRRYPKAFLEHKKACAAREVVPGKLHVWEAADVTIVNFVTKRHWRDDSRYEDIDAGLVALRKYLEQLGEAVVVVPALGCGHGRLDWTRVRRMVEQMLSDLEAEVYVYSPEDSRR